MGMKNKIKLENILCVFIIICPILDMVSFLYRNIFNIHFSPSTIIRPIIPAFVTLYLFIKKDKKFKLYSIIAAMIYGVYTIIHLYLFSKVKTQMSYSNELHELQYLVNYSFMVLNLFLYTDVFNSQNIEKLRKSILIAVSIYIMSIYLSVLTGTSSSTYIEGIGFKGWFESGNSISAILLLSIFIYLPYVKNKKERKMVIPILVFVGIFLSILIGTRSGLYGFILVIALYILIEVIYGLIRNKKLNKKVAICGSAAICAVIIIVVVFGSTTMKRRKHLQEIESNIVDETKQENSHITGSLLKIKEKIENNIIEEKYMSKEQKNAIIDLYNMANKLEIKNNDQRMQQLIYNVALVKEQKSPILIIFGNGYMANYRELVFEMELLAMLINFGILGFTLYLGPFVAILVLAIYKGIKNRKKIDGEYMFLVLGSLFAFALSLFSGYTFFNSSAMLIIIVLHTILLTKVREIDKERDFSNNEKDFIWNNRLNNPEERKEF